MFEADTMLAKYAALGERVPEPVPQKCKASKTTDYLTRNRGGHIGVGAMAFEASDIRSTGTLPTPWTGRCRIKIGMQQQSAPFDVILAEEVDEHSITRLRDYCNEILAEMARCSRMP